MMGGPPFDWAAPAADGGGGLGREPGRPSADGGAMALEPPGLRSASFTAEPSKASPAVQVPGKPAALPGAELASYERLRMAQELDELLCMANEQLGWSSIPETGTSPPDEVPLRARGAAAWTPSPPRPPPPAAAPDAFLLRSSLDPNAAAFQLSPKHQASLFGGGGSGAGSAGAGGAVPRKSLTQLQGLQDLQLPDGFMGDDGED